MSKNKYKEEINSIKTNKLKYSRLKYICKNINPNIDYLSSNWEKEFINNIDWNEIFTYQNLSENFITYFSDYIPWNKLFDKYGVNVFSKKFIVINKDKFDFYIRKKIKKPNIEFDINNVINDCKKIFPNFDYTKKWKSKFVKKISWEKEIKKYQVSQDFLEYFNSYLPWKIVSYYQINNISLDFIQKYADKLDWKYICSLKKMPEYFIDKNYIFLNWQMISQYQELSELFIKKYKDYVDWFFIAEYQNLSESFIKEILIKKEISNLYIKRIICYQKLSEKFILNNLKEINDYKYNIIYNKYINNDFILKNMNLFIDANINYIYIKDIRGKEFVEKFYKIKKLFQ